MKKSNGNLLNDETERIMANPYLVKKLIQSRKDAREGKGVKIDIEEYFFIKTK